MKLFCLIFKIYFSSYTCDLGFDFFEDCLFGSYFTEFLMYYLNGILSGNFPCYLPYFCQMSQTFLFFHGFYLFFEGEYFQIGLGFKKWEFFMDLRVFIKKLLILIKILFSIFLFRVSNSWFRGYLWRLPLIRKLSFLSCNW